MGNKKTEKEWKQKLTPEQFNILRAQGTDLPEVGHFYHFFKHGIYHCAGCNAPLFASNNKYDSGSGWPSFDALLDNSSVVLSADNLLGERERIEVSCAQCGGHLGHLFSDGPKTTGQRYCINSTAMTFDEKTRERFSSEEALFAGGCFWGVEDNFRKIPGVLEAISGYCGGKEETSTYESVCTGTTNHAESVKIVFDPTIVSYEKLVRIFFSLHNPTQLNRQGPDIGTQYRSAIFYHTESQKESAEKIIEELSQPNREIVTEVTAAKEFFPAEEYHQKYYRKRGGSCGI